MSDDGAVDCAAEDCEEPITPGDQFIMVSRMVRKPDGQDLVRGAFARYHPRCHDEDAVETVDVDAALPFPSWEQRGGRGE